MSADLRRRLGMPDRPGPVAVGATARVAIPVATDVPAHLQPATAGWYRHVAATWELDAHHLRLLQLACEAWDVAQAARDVLSREGLTVLTKDGGSRAHPLLAAATAARAQFAGLLVHLDLDDDGGAR